jgi:heparin binding hemagglutinin HbhA
MTLIPDFRRNVTAATPLMAVVGATDYAVERVRAAAGNAAQLPDELGRRVQQLEQLPATVQERVRTLDVQAVPAMAVARALEAAGRLEQSYETFAVRGKALVDRVTTQAATQDLLAQGRTTIGRTRAVVTTARRAVDETTASARAAVTTGRRESNRVVEEVAESVAATEQVVRERTKATRAAAKRTTATARKRAADTGSATRAAATSARKAAAKAADAAEAAAAKVGDDTQARSADQTAE